MSDTDNPRHCSGFTSSGQRCERIVGPSQKHCYHHDPEEAQRRKENASKAAKAKHGGERAEIVELRQEMRDLADKVLDRKVTPGIGSVVNQILGNMIKTFEQQRKQEEHAELRKEVEELKARFEVRRTSGGNSPFAGGYWSG